MGKITIEDDCLVPERFLTMTYSGKDPWGVGRKIAEMVKPFFHVSSSGTNNLRLNWDDAGDPVTFYSLWWVKVKYSRFTTSWFRIKVQGEKHKADNTGTFTLELQANLETKFSGWSPFLRTAWLMYSYLYYNRIRRKMIERCRNSTLNFRNEIKKHFELEASSTPAYGGFG